jgi:hypothetical protein
MRGGRLDAALHGRRLPGFRMWSLWQYFLAGGKRDDMAKPSEKRGSGAFSTGRCAKNQRI